MTDEVSPTEPARVPGRIGPPLLLGILLFGAWQWFVTTTGVPAVVLPGPLGVVAAAVDHWPTGARCFTLFHRDQIPVKVDAPGATARQPSSR